jgi:hypothetical protein
MRPLARSSDLVVEPVGDELIVFDSERNVAHSLNGIAARVWQACDGARDLDALAAHCGADEQTVRLALERLRDVQLLEDGGELLVAGSAEREGVSRRAMLRRSVLAGAGVGLAVPVIRSITAPSLAMAASGRSGNQVKGKAGEHCTNTSQCSPSSFCFNFAGGPSSCQRQGGASCAHTSSCSHRGGGSTSFVVLCTGGFCHRCTANSQCPGSHQTCNAGSGRCH